MDRLVKAYGSFMPRIGDPLEDGVLYGPMHSQQGVDGYLTTIEEAQALGGILFILLQPISYEFIIVRTRVCL